MKTKLPCEECVQTSNHCCKADIPHHITDALYFKQLANELNIECMIVPHPANHEGIMVLVQEKHRATDISLSPCIFMVNNRCAIYENRPTICRGYGAEYMPCRNVTAGLTTKEEIGALTKEDIRAIEETVDFNAAFTKLMES
jgi:Fe-S-cluster containining protein